MSATIIGVRHGEVHNPDGVIYAGLPGFGLSETGRDQARSVGEALRGIEVAAVYASPLDRGVETAGIICQALGADVIRDERLQEWRYWAQWAGMTWDELRTKGRDAWEAYRHDPGSVTEGESLAHLADRVQSWMDDAASAHPGGLVLAVSHLEPLRAILLRHTGRPATDLFDLEIGPGCAVRLAPHADPTALVGQALSDALS